MGKTFHKASVILGKAEAAPSLVEAVQFHGVHFTKNDALVKEIAELYKSETLHELVEKSHIAARHLQEVGLMDHAVALIDTASSTNGYVVNFVVKEPKPYVLGVKCGMSTNGDADVSLTGGCQSIGGRGESLNTSYTYTGDHNFNVSYNKPKLGWQVYSNSGVSAYRSLAYLPWNQANLDENALVFHYNGQLWKKRLLHCIKFNAIWRTLRAGDDSSFTVREHSGHTMKFSLDNSIAMDSRDRPLLATKGLLLRVAQEFAGPFGDSSFVQHQFDFQAATQLPLNTILSASLQTKQVRALGDREVHLLDRVYLGGQHDVRGFGLNSLGPREDSSSLGGGTAVAGVLHLYKPLFPPNMLYAHAFLAGGSVASLRSRDVITDLQETARVSAGIGVTFAFKNIFRLELNYVHPLKFGPSDLLNRGLHIGAGINFL